MSRLSSSRALQASAGIPFAPGDFSFAILLIAASTSDIEGSSPSDSSISSCLPDSTASLSTVVVLSKTSSEKCSLTASAFSLSVVASTPALFFIFLNSTGLPKCPVTPLTIFLIAFHDIPGFHFIPLTSSHCFWSQLFIAILLTCFEWPLALL